MQDSEEYMIFGTKCLDSPQISEHHLFHTSCFRISPPPCSHDVPFQHGLLAQDAFEVEGAQVDGLKPSVQDELRHGAAHGGRMLQPVPAETRCEVHVVDQRVQTHNAVLVESVVVVKPRPCS